MKESKKDFSNAVLHIWGYFKKETSIMEKQILFDILNKYMEGKNNSEVVIEYLNTLLKKYPNEYLEKSTLLTGEQDETMAWRTYPLITQKSAEKYDNLEEEIIDSPIYKEHNIEYPAECIENLEKKGIHLKV